MGFAHIGVLKALERNGIIPDVVVGTSIGAILGGMYCSGISVAEMEEFARNFNWQMFAKLFLPSFTRNGFIKGDNILRLFREIIGDNHIESLPKKFAAVAFDINSQQECVFTKGDLAYAMMASMSIPLIFQPLRYGKREFVDGGVVNPLPIDAAKRLQPEHIIAVNVLKKNPISDDIAFMGIHPERYEQEARKKFRPLEKRLESVMLNQTIFSKENRKYWKEKFFTMYQFFDPNKPDRPTLTIGQILVRLFYASQYYITMLKNDPSISLLIEPDVHDIDLFSFHEAHVLIDRADSLTEKMLVKSPLSVIIEQ